MNPKVDAFIDNAPQWQDELRLLRSLILDCGLTEELKWGVPCYTFQETNVLLLGTFKDNCVLSFVKGVLLQDAEGLLIQQTENSQSGRIIRFTHQREIREKAATLKAYIYEALEVEKAGLTVAYKKTAEYVIPEELTQKFAENAALKAAFEALTPGRQRGYLLHFSEPKQAQTRESRIDKCTPKILDGKGINDCTCGLSQKMPACDGSHKQLQ